MTGRPVPGKGGDAVEREEFTGFYAASFQRLVGQLYAMTADQAEAQDAVQEAFVRAWARRGLAHRGFPVAACPRRHPAEEIPRGGTRDGPGHDHEDICALWDKKYSAG
jgi:hypothetical protein